MSPDDVLQFWLGAPAADHDSFMQKIRRWFGTDKALDAEIRTRFGDALQRARDGAFDEWTKTPRGRLALIVLFDQFTRNLHRGTPRAYENDTRALALAEAGLDQHEDAGLSFEEKMFFYLPLGALGGRDAPGAAASRSSTRRPTPRRRRWRRPGRRRPGTRGATSTRSAASGAFPTATPSSGAPARRRRWLSSTRCRPKPPETPNGNRARLISSSPFWRLRRQTAKIQRYLPGLRHPHRHPADGGRDRSRGAAQERRRASPRTVGASVGILAVVKADAYGHGALACARALERKVWGFAVSLVEEGVELRRGGIEAPIVVLGSFYGYSHRDVVAFRLTPVVADERRRRDASRAPPTRWLGRSPSACTSRSTPACRASGCGPSGSTRCWRGSQQTPGVELTGLCSHLAAADADDPGADRRRSSPSSPRRAAASPPPAFAAPLAARRQLGGDAALRRGALRSGAPRAGALRLLASRRRRPTRVCCRRCRSSRASWRCATCLPASASRTAACGRPRRRRASPPCRSATPTATRAA